MATACGISRIVTPTVANRFGTLHWARLALSEPGSPICTSQHPTLTNLSRQNRLSSQKENLCSRRQAMGAGSLPKRENPLFQEAKIKASYKAFRQEGCQAHKI